MRRIAIIDSDRSLKRCRQKRFDTIYCYANGVPGTKGVRSLVADMALDCDEYRGLFREVSRDIDRQVQKLIDAASLVQSGNVESAGINAVLLKQLFAFSMGKGLGRSIEKLSIAKYAAMRGVEVVYFEDVFFQRAIGVSRIIDAMQPCEKWLDRYLLNWIVVLFGVLYRVGRTLAGAVGSFALSLFRKRICPTVIALSHASQATQEILKYFSFTLGDEGKARVGLFDYGRMNGRIQLFTLVSRRDGFRLLMQACKLMVMQFFASMGWRRGVVQVFLYKEIIPFNVGAGLYVRVFAQYLNTLDGSERITLLAGDDDVWAGGFLSILDRMEGVKQEAVLVSHGLMTPERIAVAKKRYSKVYAAVNQSTEPVYNNTSLCGAESPIARIVVVLPRFHIYLFTVLLDGLHRRRRELENRGLEVHVLLHPTTPLITKVVYYAKYPERLADLFKNRNRSLVDSVVFAYRSKFLEINCADICHLVLLDIYQNESIFDDDISLPCRPTKFSNAPTTGEIEKKLDELLRL